MPRLREHVLYGLAVIAAAAAFVWVSARLSSENVDPTSTDQSAYLHATDHARESPFLFFYDGARGPLYPMVLAIADSRSDATPQQRFDRAKSSTIAICTALVLVVFAACRRVLPPLQAFAVGMTTSFTCLVYFAPYAKADGVLFCLQLLAFLALVATAVRRRRRDALLGGTTSGVAFMLKGSALLCVAVFALVLVAGSLVGWASSVSGDRRRREAARLLVLAALVVGSFFVSASPQLVYSRSKFRTPFYNVNTTLYAWCDSFAEAKARTGPFGDREHWPSVPDADLPSPLRYAQDHSLGQVASRLVEGTRQVAARSLGSYGYGKYGAAILVGHLILLARSGRRARAVLGRHALAVAGVLGYLVAAFGSCVWFAAINAAPRLLLAAYPPLLVSGFLGMRLWDREFGGWTWFGRRFSGTALLTGVIALGLAVDVPILLEKALLLAPIAAGR